MCCRGPLRISFQRISYQRPSACSGRKPWPEGGAPGRAAAPSSTNRALLETLLVLCSTMSKSERAATCMRANVNDASVRKGPCSGVECLSRKYIHTKRTAGCKVSAGGGLVYVPCVAALHARHCGVTTAAAAPLAADRDMHLLLLNSLLRYAAQPGPVQDPEDWVSCLMLACCTQVPEEALGLNRRLRNE
jgi:hypothetical protein